MADGEGLLIIYWNAYALISASEFMIDCDQMHKHHMSISVYETPRLSLYFNKDHPLRLASLYVITI